jgi:hypothetical protein
MFSDAGGQVGTVYEVYEPRPDSAQPEDTARVKRRMEFITALAAA